MYIYFPQSLVSGVDSGHWFVNPEVPGSSFGGRPATVPSCPLARHFSVGFVLCYILLRVLIILDQFNGQFQKTSG